MKEHNLYLNEGCDGNRNAKLFKFSSISPVLLISCLLLFFVQMISPLPTMAEENSKVTKKLEKVEKLFEKSDAANALALLESLISKYPDDARSYIRLSQYYSDAKLYDDAIRYAEDATRVDPGSEGAKNVLCECYQGIGQMNIHMRQYPKAEEAYSKMYTLCPTTQNKERIIYLYSKMIESAQNKKDYSIAIEIYKKLINLEPDNPDLHYKLFRLYHANGQDEEGNKVLQNALIAFPSYVKFANALGAIYFAEKRYNEAKELFEKGLEKNPTDITMAQYYASTLQFIAQEEFEKLKEEDKLPKQKLSPGKTNASMNAYNKEKEQIKQELIQLKQGLYQPVIDAYNKLITLDTNNEHPKFIMNLAVIYGFVGLEDKMKQLYLQAAEIYKEQTIKDPEDISAWHYYGFCLVNANERLDEAEKSFKKVIELDVEKKNPTAMIYLAEIMVDQKKYEGARELLEGFKKAYPEHTARDRADQWLDYIEAVLSGTPLGQKPRKLEITEPVLEFGEEDSQGLTLDDESMGISENILSGETTDQPSMH